MLVICSGTLAPDGSHVPCGRVIGEKPDPIDWPRELYGEPMSHGYCPECLGKMLAGLEVGHAPSTNG